MAAAAWAVSSAARGGAAAAGSRRAGQAGRRVEGGGPGMPVGQPVPVRRVDHPAAADAGAGMSGEQPPAGRGVHGNQVIGDAKLEALPGPDRQGGHRVQAGFEADQAVLADPAQVPVGDQIRLCGQRQQRRPIGLGAHADHLAVGAVHLAAADRQPGSQRRVHRLQAVEVPARQHMRPPDLDLALHPALTGGPVRGQHVDGEPLVGRERGRLRMQRHRRPRRHMPPDHGLGPVIDDRRRHTP